MIALAGMGRGFHLAQQRIHLFGIQPPSGAHAHVAGQGAGNFFQPFLERQGIAGFSNLVGEIAHQTLHVQLAQHGGDLAHHHGIGSEGFDHQAQLGQLGGAGADAGDFRRVHIHHFGDQQRLAMDAAIGQRLLHALIDQPLMGGMLVDDDDAVSGLGHDIGFVQLRPGHAQRCIGHRLKGRVFHPYRHRHGTGHVGCRRFAHAAAGKDVGRAEGRRRLSLERRQRRGRHGGGGALAAGLDGVLQRPYDQSAHQPGITKAHFGLGRVHIHIHEGGIAVQEQRQRRMAVARQKIGIGAAHRPHQQLVAHRAAIDEQELHRGIGAVVGGQPGIAGQRNAFTSRFDAGGIVAEVAAHDAGQARQPSVHQIGLGGQVQRPASVQCQGKADIRPRHCQPFHDVDDGQVFGAGGFEEFQPGRGGIEQLAHLGAGAVLARA